MNPVSEYIIGVMFGFLAGYMACLVHLYFDNRRNEGDQ